MEIPVLVEEQKIIKNEVSVKERAIIQNIFGAHMILTAARHIVQAVSLDMNDRTLIKNLSSKERAYARKFVRLCKEWDDRTRDHILHPLTKALKDYNVVGRSEEDAENFISYISDFTSLMPKERERVNKLIKKIIKERS